MAKASGRDFVIKKGGTAIAAVRTKSVTWNGSTTDVTTDDSAGDTSFLADEFASTTLEMSVEGLADDDVLADLAFSATHADKHFSDLTIERANGDVISGDFIMTNYSESGSYEEAVTFSATIVRNGTHTWAPAV